MKILLINYEYPPLGGGAANATYNIALSLQKQGHSVFVATTAFGQLTGFTVENNISIYRLPSKRKAADRSNLTEMLSFTYHVLRNSEKIIKDNAIEACIAFFTVHCGIASYRIFKKYNIPYIISLRGGDVPGLVPELGLIHSITKPLRRIILKNAISIVANSVGLAELSMKADPFHVDVIPNGVDTVFFLPSETKSDIFTFLFVGRFQAQKNLFFLLKTFKELTLKTHKPLKLLMVGDGPQNNELQQYANDLGLTNIEWLGWKTKKELVLLYQSSHCFLNPSLYEGMPNTILEAMACGLPVVASDSIGNNEIILSRENGLLFPQNNLESFRDQMFELVETQEKANQIGRNARQHIVNNYSWTSVANEYMKLFKRFIL